MLKRIITLFLVSSSLVVASNKTLDSYAMCKELFFIPDAQIEVTGIVPILSTTYPDEQDRVFDATGFEVAAKVRVWDGLINGNVNYIGLRYQNIEGEADAFYPSSRLNNDIQSFELAFYEYGFKKDEESFMRLLLGYRHYERSYIDIDRVELYKNPYLGFGVGWSQEMWEDVYIGIEGDFLLVPFGKIDISVSGRTQTVDEDISAAVKVALPVVWRIDESVELKFVPEYEWWHYGESDEIQEFYASQIKAEVFNIKFALNLKF
jgi:hypothetical protein